MEYLAEETSGSTTCRRVVVDMNVVILSGNGLLNKGLGHDLVSYLDRILVNHLEFWRGAISFYSDTAQLELLDDWSLDMGSTVPIHGQTSRGGHSNLLQNFENQPTIPQECLEIDLINAERGSELDILNGFVEREALGEEGNEEITGRPCSDIWVAK